MTDFDPINDEAAGHLTNPSDASDADNGRPATSGEQEFYGQPPITAEYADPVTKGPLAGVDLVHYMRTGEKRMLRATVIAFPKPAPLPVPEDEEAVS